MSDVGVPKKRNRNRLKEFYGIRKDEHVDRSTDINSEQFKCDDYMKEVLEKKHLHELLGHQTSLLKEIRTLDSEMQVTGFVNRS